MTIAEKIIKPTKAGIFRTVFLYTGQGESTLLVIPNGPKVTDYLYVLVDSDQDKEPNEINLVDLFKDLFENSGNLSVFINTHPHNDHIGGIKKIYNEHPFDEVWHSNHKPGPKHKEKYEDLKYVIDQVGKEKEYFLSGSDRLNIVQNTKEEKVVRKLGNIDYQVLSPAQHLCDDINDENQDTRDRRIHEQCGVIKFTYGKDAKSILITGDSDKAAWQDHITDHHANNLPSHVLSASHHGSRTFFKTDEDDEDIYEDHIKAIHPTYVVISAPTQDKSIYGHPHDDAWEIYERYVEKANIFHLGKNLESVIVDIDEDGGITVYTDKELVETYGQKDDDDDNDGGKDKKDYRSIYVRTTRIDNKPMGNDAVV